MIISYFDIVWRVLTVRSVSLEGGQYTQHSSQQQHLTCSAACRIPGTVCYYDIFFAGTGTLFTEQITVVWNSTFISPLAKPLYSITTRNRWCAGRCIQEHYRSDADAVLTGGVVQRRQQGSPMCPSRPAVINSSWRVKQLTTRPCYYVGRMEIH